MADNVQKKKKERERERERERMKEWRRGGKKCRKGLHKKVKEYSKIVSTQSTWGEGKLISIWLIT